MITSKQRKQLSALAQTVTPIFQIGKNGVTETFLAELNDALEARELVKITVLKNSDLNAKETLNLLCDTLRAEPVSCVGFKITMYRFSMKKDVEHIKVI